MPSVTDSDLMAVLEGSFFLFPPVSPGTRRLDIPGVQGHISAISHAEANMVGLARLSQDNVDATIQHVIDVFRSEKKAFGWYVGPFSTPSDLPARLCAAGLTLALEEAGMALTDLHTDIPSNPNVRVRDVTPDELRAAVPMVARAQHSSEEMARHIVDFFTRLRRRVEVPLYLAYPHGEERAVAFSVSIYLPDQPIAVLQGAATLPEYRGRGIYSTLLARRVADARTRGIEAVVVQAIRTTSAPIVRRYGFRELCSLEHYAWDPGPV